VVAQKPSVPASTPFTLASAATPPNIAPSTPASPANVAKSQAPVVAQAQSVPSPTPVPVLPAQPVPPDAAGTLASNAGGGSWKTLRPGRMLLGRLINRGVLRDVADHGLAGERFYLKGQFVVNFSDANKAVLRPRTKLTDKFLPFGGGSSTLIIVEFPAGYVPPHPGVGGTPAEARPHDITQLR